MSYNLKSWITSLLFLAVFLALLLGQNAITTWLYGTDCYSRIFTACYEQDIPPGQHPPEDHLQ